MSRKPFSFCVTILFTLTKKVKDITINVDDNTSEHFPLKTVFTITIPYVDNNYGDLRSEAPRYSEVDWSNPGVHQRFLELV